MVVTVQNQQPTPQPAAPENTLDTSFRTSVKYKKGRSKKKLIYEQNGKCFYCHLRMDTSDVTIEHLLAKSRGGTNDIENLRVAHGLCNQLVGCLSVERKLELSELGRTQGSDAFFKIVQQGVNAKTRRRKKQRARRAAKLQQENRFRKKAHEATRLGGVPKGARATAETLLEAAKSAK